MDLPLLFWCVNNLLKQLFDISMVCSDHKESPKQVLAPFTHKATTPTIANNCQLM